MTLGVRIKQAYIISKFFSNPILWLNAKSTYYMLLTLRGRIGNSYLATGTTEYRVVHRNISIALSLTYHT